MKQSVFSTSDFLRQQLITQSAPGLPFHKVVISVTKYLLWPQFDSERPERETGGGGGRTDAKPTLKCLFFFNVRKPVKHSSFLSEVFLQCQGTGCGLACKVIRTESCLRADSP